MLELINIMLVIFLANQNIEQSPDCPYMNRLIESYGAQNSDLFSVYYSDLKSCNITFINGVYIDDYFSLDSDPMLGMCYVNLNDDQYSVDCVDYMVQNKRWDLLLQKMDQWPQLHRHDQTMFLLDVFYRRIPDYFYPTIVSNFNRQTTPLKRQLAQTLVPNTIAKLSMDLDRLMVLFPHWSQFDQWMFFIHTKRHFPHQFDQLNEFWQRVLTVQLVDDPDKVYALLTILNQDSNQPSSAFNPNNISPQLLGMLYLSQQKFQSLRDLINQDESVALALYRYLDLFPVYQQEFLINSIQQLSMNGVISVLGAPVLQLHPSIVEAVKQRAIALNMTAYLSQSDDLDDYSIRSDSIFINIQTKSAKKKMTRLNITSMDDFIALLPRLSFDEGVQLLKSNPQLMESSIQQRYRWFRYIMNHMYSE